MRKHGTWHMAHGTWHMAHAHDILHWCVGVGVGGPARVHLQRGGAPFGALLLHLGDAHALGDDDDRLMA
eukprot:4352851-Prymnesium_polylepis.2